MFPTNVLCRILMLRSVILVSVVCELNTGCEGALGSADLNIHNDISTEDEEDILQEPRMRLFQYNPIQKDHVQYVTDESGREMTVKTLAVNPPLFEIRDFLSQEECDHIIALAEKAGLDSSKVVKEFAPSVMEIDEDETNEVFYDLDGDEDGLLNPNEGALALMDIVDGVLSDEDFVLLSRDLQIDKNTDGFLDIEEFKLSWTVDMERNIEKWVEAKRESNETFRLKKTRVSDQTWLEQLWSFDPVLTRVQERIIRLTQLPEMIIKSSESLQVVRYQPGGHYHAHYDSNELEDSRTCSHTYGLDLQMKDREFEEKLEKVPLDGNEVHQHDHEDKYDAAERADDEDEVEEEPYLEHDAMNTRLCRFATILYYLNDVEEGGETAFPMADNETFSDEAIDTMSYDMYDLTDHCDKSNIKVSPGKGKAVLWYNHHMTTDTHWMGELHNYSLHGGCDVLKGTKWIANNWITVDDNYDRQISLHENYQLPDASDMENKNSLLENEVKEELRTSLNILSDYEQKLRDILEGRKEKEQNHDRDEL